MLTLTGSRLYLILAAAILAGALTGLLATALTADPAHGPFIAETQVAIDTMMAGMNVKSSGDVDRDFAAMMIPHHQGAIDMARAELRYGKNETLRRIAQEIIVDQQQEIVAMRLAIGAPPPLSSSASDRSAALAPSAQDPAVVAAAKVCSRSLR